MQVQDKLSNLPIKANHIAYCRPKSAGIRSNNLKPGKKKSKVQINANTIVLVPEEQLKGNKISRFKHLVPIKDLLFDLIALFWLFFFLFD